MTEIPEPRPGLVVHFNYLWSREQAQGRVEARYPRPCAIVLSARPADDGSLIVLLAPITHSEPRDGETTVELPAMVKAHLGLDGRRSWVVLDELNETRWPGYDLAPNARGEYVYGALPPRLFRAIRNTLLQVIRAGVLTQVRR